MRRELHVRFWEGGGVKFPSATRRNIYVRSRRAGERVMRPAGAEPVLKLCGCPGGISSGAHRGFAVPIVTRECKQGARSAPSPHVPQQPQQSPHTPFGVLTDQASDHDCGSCLEQLHSGSMAG